MVTSLEQSPVAHALLTGRKLTEGNAAFQKLFPWLNARRGPTLHQFLGKHHTALAREILELEEPDASTDTVTVPQVRFSTAEGTALYCTVTARRLPGEGKRDLLLSFENVTPWAEEAALLRLSEEQHKLLAENGVAPLAVLQENRLVHANRAAAELFAFESRDEMAGREIASFILGRERKATLQKLQPGEPGSRTVNLHQFTGVRKKGELLNLAVRCETIEFNGKPAVLAAFTDLTAQYKATEETRRRVQENALVEQILHAAQNESHLVQMLEHLLDASLSSLGFDGGGAYKFEGDAGEMVMIVQRNLPEKVLEKISAQNAQEGVAGYIVKTGEPLILNVEEYPAHLPYRALFSEAGYKTLVYLPLHTGPDVHAVMVFAGTKTPEHLAISDEMLKRLGTMLGVVARHAALYDRVTASEERYRAAVEGAASVIYVAAPNGAFLLLSPGVEMLLGFPPADFQRNPDLWRNLIHPDDRTGYSARIAAESGTEEQITLEYRILPRGKASYRQVRDAVRYERGAGGAVVRLIGVVTDVSAESPAAPQATHSTSERGKDELQRDLHESEETLRNVIDAMGDALMITDLQGKVWEVNREFTKVSGYGRTEALGTAFPYPWLVEREMAKFVSWITALREKQFLRDFDMTWRSKDGCELAMSINTTLLRNTRGEPMAMLNIARDISDRKRLANELEVKNKQIEMLNRIISKANSTIDFQKIFESIAVEVLGLLAYDQISVALLSDDERSLTVLSSMSPDGPALPPGTRLVIDHEPARLALERGAAVLIEDIRTCEELPAPLRERAELRSYAIVPILLKGKALGVFTLGAAKAGAFTGESLDYLLPIADQMGAVIDRMQLFAKVSADSAYIHNLMDSLDSIIFTVDTDLRIGQVNSAWQHLARFIGGEVDEGDASGRLPEEVIPAPALWDDVRTVAPALFAGTRKKYEREFELHGTEGGQRAYYLAISPMVIDAVVTALVCSITDITESKRSEEEIRRRNRELMALNAVSASINMSLKLDQVLHEAAMQVRENIGATAVLCYLRSKDGGGLVLAHQVGVPPELASEIQKLDAATSLTGQAMRGRTPVIVSSGAHEDTRLKPEGQHVAAALGMESLMVLPLISKDDVLGAFTIGHAEEHVAHPGEQEFLMLIGNQLGAAIENAQLYEEVRAQVRRLTSLNELSQALTGALDRDTLIDIVMTQVKKTLPYDRFAYHKYVRDRGVFELAVEVTGEKRFMAIRGEYRPSIPLESEPAAMRVIKEEQSVLEVGDDGRSALAVPVRTRGDIVGVLSLERHTGPAYESDHLRLLESIANLSKIATDRTLLYEEIVAKSEELEARNKELDDFTYVVSHDLKEPLITIEGFSKIVLNEYRAQLDDEGKSYLTSLVNSSVRMKQLIDDLLMLSRVGRSADASAAVSVEDVLRDVLRDFEFTLRKQHARVELPADLPRVRFNPTQLGMVFRNLISNAVKFNRRDEPLVKISVSETPAEYQFSVTDNGIGIAPQHYEKIFVIFQRLHRREEYDGTGAGLTIVKKIVENHGGCIWLDSRIDEGTTFTFTVPK